MFGTVVAHISNVEKAKLQSLDKRLKGNIPPCLSKNLYHGAPKPLFFGKHGGILPLRRLSSDFSFAFVTLEIGVTTVPNITKFFPEFRTLSEAGRTSS